MPQNLGIMFGALPVIAARRRSPTRSAYGDRRPVHGARRDPRRCSTRLPARHARRHRDEHPAERARPPARAVRASAGTRSPPDVGAGRGRGRDRRVQPRCTSARAGSSGAIASSSTSSRSCCPSSRSALGDGDGRPRAGRDRARRSPVRDQPVGRGLGPAPWLVAAAGALGAVDRPRSGRGGLLIAGSARRVVVPVDAAAGRRRSGTRPRPRPCCRCSARCTRPASRPTSLLGWVASVVLGPFGDAGVPDEPAVGRAAWPRRRAWPSCVVRRLDVPLPSRSPRRSGSALDADRLADRRRARTPTRCTCCWSAILSASSSAGSGASGDRTPSRTHPRLAPRGSAIVRGRRCLRRRRLGEPRPDAAARPGRSALFVLAVDAGRAAGGRGSSLAALGAAGRRGRAALPRAAAARRAVPGAARLRPSRDVDGFWYVVLARQFRATSAPAGRPRRQARRPAARRRAVRPARAARPAGVRRRGVRAAALRAPVGRRHADDVRVRGVLRERRHRAATTSGRCCSPGRGSRSSAARSRIVAGISDARGSRRGRRSADRRAPAPCGARRGRRAGRRRRCWSRPDALDAGRRARRSPTARTTWRRTLARRACSASSRTPWSCPGGATRPRCGTASSSRAAGRTSRIVDDRTRARRGPGQRAGRHRREPRQRPGLPDPPAPGRASTSSSSATRSTWSPAPAAGLPGRRVVAAAPRPTMTAVTARRAERRRPRRRRACRALSYFFPAHNEAENIEALVDEALEVLPKLADEFEIIAVNDGSKDADAGDRRPAGRRAPGRRAGRPPRRQPRLRRRAAVGLRGRRASSSSRFTDGDRQFQVADLGRLIERMARPDHPDVVVGYRIKRADPFIRIAYARTYRLANRIFFGLRVRDVDCACKLFRREALEGDPGRVGRRVLLGRAADQDAASAAGRSPRSACRTTRGRRARRRARSRR